MLIVWLAALVAVGAAARSTWSPCGLSMLSSITPFSERSRGHRYWATAGWFLAGSVVGGLTLGALGAVLALVVGHSMLVAAAVCVAVAGLVDAGALGPVLPLIRRQVNDRWLSTYRPWVYASGFGWQIGSGLATYLMTAGVVVVPLLGALSGRWPAALLLGGLFGLARGSTVFLTAGASSPDRLRSIHARLDRFGPAVRWGLVGLQAGAAAALALGVPVGIGLLLAVGGWAIGAVVAAAPLRPMIRVR
ncbi:MAG TPA: hypothetical protein VG435_08880 [Acidimicrobiales bacterium]|nr:hypothetical protein [Acidimicrobiales bacterium]